MSKVSRRPRRAHRHDPWIGTLVGWYESEHDRAEAQHRSHDALISLLGADRRGGVGWNHFAGDEAFRFLDRLCTDEHDPALLDHYANLRALLTERGGWLVMASAEAVRP